MLTIGKLAAAGAISPDALRYYETERLLAPSARTARGYRLYGEDALRRVRFIQHAQACGFTLAQIGELLQLRQTDKACCNDVRQRGIEKRLQLAAKIRSMQSMSAALDRLIAECADGSQSVDDCPILAAQEQIDDGTVKVELIYAPGCAECMAARAGLRSAAEAAVAGVEWIEINVPDALDSAVELGVLTLPALAIDGSLAFAALPTPAQLRQELLRRTGHD